MLELKYYILLQKQSLIGLLKIIGMQNIYLIHKFCMYIIMKCDSLSKENLST